MGVIFLQLVTRYIPQFQSFLTFMEPDYIYNHDTLKLVLKRIDNAYNIDVLWHSDSDVLL
jgi:hypothetical protein